MREMKTGRKREPQDREKQRKKRESKDRKQQREKRNEKEDTERDGRIETSSPCMESQRAPQVRRGTPSQLPKRFPSSET